MLYSIRNKLRKEAIRVAGIAAGLITVYAAVQVLGFILRAFVTQRPVASTIGAVGTNVMAQNHPDFVLKNMKTITTSYLRRAYETGVPLGEEAAKQMIDQNVVGNALTYAFTTTKQFTGYAAKNLAYGAGIAATSAKDNVTYYATQGAMYAAARGRRMFAW